MPTALQGPPVAAPRPQLWRITDRRSFQALQQRGRRTRQGPVTVTWLAPVPGPATPPRVGFAVGRSVGGAVLRNRIRRRLRAALRELQAEDRLPAGTYLIGGRAELAELPWPALVERLGAAVHEATS